MSSKKKWKKRAKRQERFADELFIQVTGLSGQLATIDNMLHDAEFPGPTIDAWVAQCQQFLNKLVEERGIVKKSSSGLPVETLIPVPSISGPNSGLYGSISNDTGEYELLQDNATRG